MDCLLSYLYRTNQGYEFSTAFSVRGIPINFENQFSIGISASHLPPSLIEYLCSIHLRAALSADSASDKVRIKQTCTTRFFC